ncbi:MAG: phosphoenolpyruvate--protein phosphotransferase [Planctomycetes bacterium]|nr:phosphoenolpyruvate--protein phosphotransferase [Planctomycetota bacterium]
MPLHPRQQRMILTGKTISPGLARGITRVIDARGVLDAALSVAPSGPPQAEVERLHAAVGRAGVELDRLQRQLSGRLDAGDVAIFASHAGLLHDPKFLGRIEAEIRVGGQSAEAAVSRVASELRATFLANPVPLVRDKATDILDIGRRLVRCLSASLQPELEMEQGTIVVATSLTPSQLVRYSHHGIAGVVTETCGPKSHTAILARGLGIPLITGIAGACELIPQGTTAIVDAAAARVVFQLTDAERESFQDLFEQQAAALSDAEEAPPELPITQDGSHIRLLLNISDAVEAAGLDMLGADGVGLFRTEFAYMDREGWPTTDEIYASYRQLAEIVGDRELHIRLVDFGAEKCPPYSDIPLSRNPSLGLRGIRLLLQREDILLPQVQAITRLAHERRLTLLLPMLDTVDTLTATIDTLCRTIGCASREQFPFRLGAMIEVPSAALQVAEILPQVDSVSIGLNDLTQYLLAADRDDEFVERYHDPMQPAVLRLLQAVVATASAAGKPLTICGELAGDPKLTGLLLALGVRRLSVARSNYRGVANSIRRLSLRSMEGVGAEITAQPTAAAVRKYVAERFG